MSKSETGEKGTKTGEKNTPVNVQIDHEMVRDTLWEILNEIPAFKTLAAAGSSSSGSTVNASALNTSVSNTSVTNSATPPGSEFDVL